MNQETVLLIHKQYNDIPLCLSVLPAIDGTYKESQLFSTDSYLQAEDSSRALQRLPYTATRLLFFSPGEKDPKGESPVHPKPSSMVTKTMATPHLH